MTQRPTRGTVDGRAYLDLQNLARRSGRPTDELHQLYALEGFLDRLTRSAHDSRFVLKGGVLLAAYDTRRPTRDVDLSTSVIADDLDTIRQAISEVLVVDIDDGLSFDTTATSAESIREDDQYSGVRVHVSGRLASARLRFHVDVNIGDPITPSPTTVAIPRLLGGELYVAGYPIEMVLAEKIVTAIERGTVNTRWRDFVDIRALTSTQEIHADQLDASLRAVARFRSVQLSSLDGVLAGYPALAQTRWERWRAKNRLEQATPELFEDLLDAVMALADPVIDRSAGGRIWHPATRSWT